MPHEKTILELAPQSLQDAIERGLEDFIKLGKDHSSTKQALWIEYHVRQSLSALEIHAGLFGLWTPDLLTEKMIAFRPVHEFIEWKNSVNRSSKM